ncbi:S-layer homology domain-containing protein [Paenibacillus anseongensis]|uniref:SLH domain-containing protein n=1 Tax=Paenibacillus anseongense TaxID=2682845 RepID=A0ABW9UJ49_9BACL|nr:MULTISPECIES: S-layer homology domain-containing protein [Paenibacillus]MVQ39307.1 hypothetical protein [Paenibacillus anseongense]
MLKMRFKKFTSVLLFICMLVAPMSQAIVASAEEANVNSSALDVQESQVNGEYSLNLSQLGNVDWLHFKGNGANNLTQIRKASSSAVTFSVYGDNTTGFEGKMDRGSDANYLSYTWDNGMSGYETGNKDTGFGVFFPNNRTPGTYDNVGWTFTVAPQPQESTVVFGIGMWQAKVDVKIYANNTLVETKKISAGGTSQVYKYQIKVPANVQLKVEGLQTETISQWGNMSFSGLAVSSVEIADKLNLHNEYNNVKDWTQKLYTDVSWQVFVAARDNANRILEEADASQAEINDALNALLAAKTALTKKETNMMIDFTGTEKNEYAFGDEVDQQARYQTFTVNEGYEMEYVQFVIKQMASDANDLVVKLYNTNSNGLPVGSPLKEVTVSKDSVIDGGLTTVHFNYTLANNTRYAIVLTQSNLVSGKYRWVVMDKNEESSSEFFGKTVSGNFISEAQLGTGILRIIKKTAVNRNSLQTFIKEISKYNSKLYTVQSWSALKTALSNANGWLNNFDATQIELDGAQNQLQKAFDSLVLTRDITSFVSQIDAISRAVVKGYTESSVTALNSAITAAKALSNDALVSEKIKAFSAVLNAIDALKVSGKYQYETHANMTAAFGFESDKNASLAFLDGSYQIGGNRPMQHGPIAPKQMVTFGVTDTSNIKWYLNEGYLPVFVSEFTKDDVQYKIENFGNKHTVDNKDYVIDYSRITATNVSNEARLLPVVSSNLIPLNDNTKYAYVVNPGESVVREYAVEADKYEYFNEGVTNYTSLTMEQVIAQGSYDTNYHEMSTYWKTRLSDLVDLDLPNKELVQAFKAGYIDTMIIKDGNFLHVGENGYARLFSHDTIGILVQLIQSGDFQHAKDYLKSVPLTGGINIETGVTDVDLYWDANWKLPWAYAVYLSKTGDTSIFKESMTAEDGTVGTVFEKRIKYGAKRIEADRVNGIMKNTLAIDSDGNWTIDNYSALTGLTAYEYITRELYRLDHDDYYLNEAEWAKAQYEDLLAKFTARLQQTITEKRLNYIPASVVQSNDENRMHDSRDANWASMFLFGLWQWDGYLYGADQPEDNINLTMLDDTYSYGINRRVNEKTTDSPYNFGGYPHGFYSSAYNAGYGSAALRGEKYRDMGIKAYEFMIENSMSGPFSWWEGIAYPESSSPWAKTNDNLNVHNTPGGGGSAPHMWGQSVNSKVLVDSLIAERIYEQNKKYDIIVGRGIPNEWVVDAAKNSNVVANVQNYPALQGGRVGYTVVRDENKLVFTFNTKLDQAKIDASGANFSVQLPIMVNNILDASAGVINHEKGIVTVPVSTKNLTIYLTEFSNNARLADLAVDQGTLSPAFSPSTMNYAVSIPNTASSLNFNLTKADPNETLSVTGAVQISESGNVYSYRSSDLLVGSNAVQIMVTAGDGKATSTYNITINRAQAETPTHTSDRDSTSQSIPDNNKVTSTDGKLTVPVGKIGEVSFGGDAVKVSIPKDASDQEIKLTIEKVVGTDTLLQNQEILASPVYEILKNFSDNFSKAVTLTFAFDPKSVKSNQKAAVFYYDEGKKMWVEVPGGQVNGNFISVEVNHFTKYAVLVVDNKDVITENPSKGTVTFSDVAGHWAESSIKQAVSNGIVNGYSDGTFKPEHAVTRAEFAVMLIHTLKQQGEGAPLTFTDTAKIGSWAQKEVAQAVQAGMISGYEDGSFRPDAEITRSEMASMIAKALSLRIDLNTTTNFADDQDIPQWAKGAVEVIKKLGIIEGKGENVFAPAANTTRAEAVTVLLKMTSKK